MGIRLSRSHFRIGCLIAAIVFCLCFGNEAFSKDIDPHMTGLPELTKEELEWQNKHMKRVRKVKLNKLGLERINNWRKKKGLKKLTEDEAGVVPKGKEIDGVIGEPTDAEPYEAPSPSGSLPGDLPPGVDNSTLLYFPPIRNQGSLPSCGCFSGTYYTMTYMFAMANELDAKHGGDDYRLSPKWTYNMVNNGESVGSWYYWAYDIGQKHGVASWMDFPYDSDFREWSLNANVWHDAVYRRFDQYGYVADTHTDAGIEQVKQMLVNGYILNFPTYINSWQYKTISNDSTTTEDDAFVGKSCGYWVNGTNGYHAMTVVGYNDHIWVDINSNGTVDTGEKGAFRIANSWGTGWRESGFVWMAYDALKNPSAVNEAPSTGRIYGWSPSRAHWVTARTNYQPELLAEFTLNHLKRNQLRITLGLSETSDTAPSTTWYPEMIYSQGGPYAFDGTTTATDGTFVFDFTDIAPSGGGLKRYHLGVYDSTTGDTAELKHYKVIDLSSGSEPSCDTLPDNADASQLYASVDYDYNNGNLVPTAVASADPTDGNVPLLVTFDGSDSYDSDGTIVSYEWNFDDDGAIGSGASTSHLYETAGTYQARLTVTDDSGSMSDDMVTIDVSGATTCNNDTVCDGVEFGEDCNTCPSDCTIEQTSGSCDACFKRVCNGDCNPRKEGPDCPDCAPSSCCGDGTCEGAEDSFNCAVDCGPPPICGDGICEGNETVENCMFDCGCQYDDDCNDGDTCTNDTCNTSSGQCENDWPACSEFSDGCCGPTCSGANDPDCASDCLTKSTQCNNDGDCCSNKCRGGKCR